MLNLEGLRGLEKRFKISCPAFRQSPAKWRGKCNISSWLRLRTELLLPGKEISI
jgi:hypothetical protein